MRSASHDLTVLDQASRILAEAKSLDDIKAIRDKAEAARAYVKAAKLGLELQNRAAEVKLRAERKAGGLLRSLKLRGGDRRSKGHGAPLKLLDLGITRDQSKRWQHVASISDAEFSSYLKEMIGQGHEITSAGLLRNAGKDRRTAHRNRPSSHTEKASDRVENHTTGELLHELMNHCRLLGDVLRPVYEEDIVDLKRGEKRIVGRLIREMSELIAQLQKTWLPGLTQTATQPPNNRETSFRVSGKQIDED